MLSLSFGMQMNSFKQLFVLALTLVFVFAVAFSNISFTYKVGIAVLVFSLIFLFSLAEQVGQQEEERLKRLRS